MKSTITCLILVGFMTVAAHQAGAQSANSRELSNYDYQNAFQQRRDSIINYFVNSNQPGYATASARFYSGRKILQAIAFADSMVRRQELHPSGDMFWMYPMVMMTYTGDKYLPPDIKRRMRALWKNYHPYRGDTENHWAMFYSTLYLITQYYPDKTASEWFYRNSTEKMHKEARDYLISWMKLTTSKGQGEFNSPRYFEFYVTPMAELYAFAKDPVMKQRAKMMLDYLFADYAVDNLDGLDTGPHSRIYPEQAINHYKDLSRSQFWLEYGTPVAQMSGTTLYLAISGYHIPKIIYHIANDRSKPFIQKKVKRTRFRIRNSKLMMKPVYSYLYMSKDYSLGSIQGGLLQPIQQQTWDLTWSLPDSVQGQNNLFSLSPYYGGFELGMYFPEDPEMNTQNVIKSKGTYNKIDKWTGGSPYERVYQHKSALIALYNISKKAHYHQIDAHFPTSAVIDRHNKGWIFVHGGNMYAAYYPLRPYTWTKEKDGYRLRSKHLRNGAVVQAAHASDYASFDAFKKAVEALPLEVDMKPIPSVKFTTLNGNRLSFTFGKTPVLNGKKVDYKSWKLFDSPFLSADLESRKLLMKYGNMRRLLNFKNLTIKDWIVTDSSN